MNNKKMKVMTFRIDEETDSLVKKFSSENGICNQQRAYRKLIMMGLTQSTSLSDPQAVIFEDSALEELKIITNILTNTVGNKEMTSELRKITKQHMSNKIIKTKNEQ
jgi:hypothetical protein